MTPAKKQVKSKRNNSSVNKIVAAIKLAQHKARTSKIEFIRAQLEIGTQLTLLQEEAGQNWKKWRDSVGYKERKAQRMQQISKGPLLEVIRTIGTESPELGDRLPAELQNLCALSRLTCSQIIESLKAGWDCDTMDRTQLSNAVKAVKASKDNTPIPSVSKSKAAKRKGTSSDENGSENSPKREDEGDGERVMGEEPAEGKSEARCDLEELAPSSAPESGLRRLTVACERIDEDLETDVLSEVTEAGASKEKLQGVLDAVQRRRVNKSTRAENPSIIVFPASRSAESRPRDAIVFSQTGASR